MRVLITGHLGYIGPIMIRTFKDAGHFVCGLDTGFFRECLTSETDVPPDAEIMKDIRRVEPAELEGFDCVVHLAALSNDPLGELAPELTDEINHHASIRVARLAKSVGVKRFVFASSCSIYGASDNTSPIDEEGSLNPVSIYAVSKVKTEADLGSLADAGFSPVYLRNATAYGVSPRMRLDLVLNNLIAWAKSTGRVRVLSDGTPWRPLVHIEDISQAALCAAEAPKSTIHNQAFNIGSDDANYRVGEIAKAVARSVPAAHLEITGESSGDLRSYKVNFDKASRKLPGFHPVWDIERGCRQIGDWFDSRGETVDTFQSRRFIRLKQIKHLISDGAVSPSLFWTTKNR
ncbi:SDR family oxidoreductase [Steroidobacter sp. S1-65]|uniref:SDR family oxidoreductase n=1 Tax=Steroidobacter gossypii TaxID=2805490 RepID=A0ABS1X6Q9_9GAMM|nr:SDR family oxidoreductase [Steroidobacter gossypii]MBM0108908.1 SDR family oxidoreductase [Steroidobacter gossypii]